MKNKHFKSFVILAAMAFVAIVGLWLMQMGLENQGDTSRIITLSLYDVKYFENGDTWILLFQDRYRRFLIFKVKQQPLEGWWVTRLYRVEISSDSIKFNRIEGGSQSEEPKEAQENQNPGKAF